ncbi:MAG: ABC transporter permease, partial [Chitinophagaceae bacterium]|nr:ABC transporter permease [Chitinophagaceae bacterium]
MLKNYFKIALRNLWKNKGFSFINIFGLAIGIAVCLLMMLFVIDEISYDKFNAKANRIYRVDGDVKFGGTHWILAVAPDPMGPTLKKDYPQVEQFVRFRDNGGFRIKKGNENLQENKVIYADSTLFDVFTLPMIAGDAKTALTEPKSLVITEKIARKYFNSTDVVGKIFIVNDTSNYKITGVIKNVPIQSHFNFDFFVSMSSIDESRKNNWLSNNFNTYILLKEGADPKTLESQLETVVDKYVGAWAQQFLNTSLKEFKKMGNFANYSLSPLTKIHLHSDKTAELAANGNLQYVYIFSAIGIFILLIACVNFMNLSTAHSSNRAKEVGVRKVLGSMKQNLVYQFLSESILISFIALLFAVAFAALLLPYFNQLSGKEIELGLFSKGWLIPSLLLLVFIVGLLAGSYPAFYLSSFQPVSVLKGKLATGFKSGWFRSSLVVFQFAISIILIVGTVVIYNQLQFIHNKKLGFEREHVLVIKNTYSLGDQAKSFNNELQNISGVQQVTMTGWLPTGDYRSDSPLYPEATLDQKSAISMQNWYVDETYIPTLQMQLAKGRNFSSQMPTDSSALIINEAAAKLLNFTDPLSKTLYYVTSLKNKTVKEYHIVGVVKDFNFNSLRQTVSPLALFYGEEKGSVAMRIKTGNISSLLTQVENKWKSIVPGQPFNYSFMDDDFNKIYSSEQRVGKIAMTFSILAILIACLGLFGLVTYAAEQRTKEIGIRKVLGATVSNIVAMLSKDFLKLVMIAALIAFPIAWWAMNKWLQD